jgi:hypothetical protein
MPTPPSQHTNSSEWRSLFRAALVETDCKLVEKRISDAEQAIITRSVEIFRQSGLDVDIERDVLSDALYILRARRSGVENNTAGVRNTRSAAI